MLSTGPGDRSESRAIAVWRWGWAVVGGQVAEHGCPGSAACQVLCQGFYTGLSPQMWSRSSFECPFKKRKLRPRKFKWFAQDHTADLSDWAGPGWDVFLQQILSTFSMQGLCQTSWGWSALQEVTNTEHSPSSDRGKGKRSQRNILKEMGMAEGKIMSPEIWNSLGGEGGVGGEVGVGGVTEGLRCCHLVATQDIAGKAESYNGCC